MKYNTIINFPEKGIESFSLSANELQTVGKSYSKVFFYMLVESGTALFAINENKYSITPATLVIFAPEYSGQLLYASSDFRSEMLIVTKSFLDTLPASDSMYKHIAKVMLQQRQVNPLNKSQQLVLSESIRQIQKKLRLLQHHLYREIVQNSLVAFLLEISNIWIENHWDLWEEYNQVRYEYVLKRFIEVLMQNYRKEHLVPFYAGQLNITPQYLSLIVKSLTGRTPSQFIFERLYCEARTLLCLPIYLSKKFQNYYNFLINPHSENFLKNMPVFLPSNFRKKMTHRNSL